MSQDCIFCKIAWKKIESDLIYEDDKVVAFKDLNPQAPIHVLIVPREHYAEILEAPASITGHIFSNVVPVLVDKFGLESTGFRLVVNTGKQGGQTVEHLHVHLLGGRDMTWPPG